MFLNRQNPFYRICFDNDDTSGSSSSNSPEPEKKDEETRPEEKTYTEDYVRGVRQEAAKYRTKLRELEERLGKLDEIDPEEFARLKAEKEEMEQKRLESKGEFDKIREKLIGTHRTELAKKDEEIGKRDARIAALEAELNKTILDNAISIEAAAAKCLNSRLIGMQLASEGRIETTEDGRRIIKLFNADGSLMLNTKGDPMTIRERLSEMKADEQYAMLFEGATQGAGSSTKGSTFGSKNNPFMRGPSFNLTKQGELVRTQPELAKRLAAEAGVTLSI